jgi:beta-mannosidase
MVWHDFMFGGAMVPGDKAFQDNVRAEATEQVQRLSDHPSLVLWCGNNEVETAWHPLG